ncbi:MAG TPA: hypothetical protein VK862_05145, partial [Afifellaceae bacterium]|nr:hypothetical protein [Afifellaceae bacterium]
MTAAHILRTTGHSERQAKLPSGWRRRCLAGLVFAGLAAGATEAAAEGNVHSLSLDIGPGILGVPRVISTNGQNYSILAQNDITLGYNLEISMQWGEVKGWGLYWGECSNINNCGAQFSKPLLDSRLLNPDIFEYDTSNVIAFPSSVL